MADGFLDLIKLGLYYPPSMAQIGSPTAHSEMKGRIRLKNGSGLTSSYDTRYLALQGGVLVIYNEDQTTPLHQLSCQLVTVRMDTPVSKKSGDGKFSVITPDQTFKFKADTQGLAQQWQQRIEQAVLASLNSSPTKTQNPVLNVKDVQDRVYENSSNKACADCGSPNPEWTSISLGITLCIACSGTPMLRYASPAQVRPITLCIACPGTAGPPLQDRKPSTVKSNILPLPRATHSSRKE